LDFISVGTNFCTKFVTALRQSRQRMINTFEKKLYYKLCCMSTNERLLQPPLVGPGRMLLPSIFYAALTRLLIMS